MKKTETLRILKETKQFMESQQVGNNPNLLEINNQALDLAIALLEAEINTKGEL